MEPPNQERPSDAGLIKISHRILLEAERTHKLRRGLYEEQEQIDRVLRQLTDYGNEPVCDAFFHMVDDKDCMGRLAQLKRKLDEMSVELWQVQKTLEELSEDVLTITGDITPVDWTRDDF